MSDNPFLRPAPKPLVLTPFTCLLKLVAPGQPVDSVSRSWHLTALYFTCRAKQAAEERERKDEAAVAGVAPSRASSSPAAAAAAGTSPAAADRSAEMRLQSAEADAARPESPGSPAAAERQREPSAQPAASTKAAAGGSSGVGAPAEQPAEAPKPAVPVRHTDDAAKAAARERYLARKKRKAEGHFEPPA